MFDHTQHFYGVLKAKKPLCEINPHCYRFHVWKGLNRGGNRERGKSDKWHGGGVSNPEKSRPSLIPGLTYASRAREQVSFKRNKLPKYGSEKAFKRSSIGKALKMIIMLKETGTDLRATLCGPNVRALSIILLTSEGKEKWGVPFF